MNYIKLWALMFAITLTFLYIFVIMLVMNKGLITALVFAGFLISLAIWIKIDLEGV